MSKRRVVITGYGIVSPLGNNIAQNWQNLVQGKSGVSLITDFDTSAFSTKFAGLVKDFDIAPYLSIKEARKCDLFIQYGVAAACQAIKMAGLDQAEGFNLDRVGVAIGSGIGGLGTIENTGQTLSQFGPKKISPFFIPASIVNMIAGHVSILYGLRGPNFAVATACTTGTHCIGMAYRAIAYGDADLMVAGGAEKASCPLGLGGFAAARALSSRNDNPAEASRPWDKDRDGFVLGDGSGVMVLEEYEHAKARNAPILAELVGFGMSGDAFHITRPGGNGAVRSMQAALDDAKLNAAKLDYINAHGTSTQVGDLEETRAIKLVMGEQAKNIVVSSTKSMTGHLLGAAGAIEAIYSVLALEHQIVPPTINLAEADEGCDLDYVPNHARDMQLSHVLSNSFGFGGTNATLIFAKA